MLNWANRFNICCLLDSHQYHLPLQTRECLLAAGSLDSIHKKAGEAFSALAAFSDARNDWIFGHLGYDLKNELENLDSSHPDYVGFPDLFFFVPEIVIQLEENRMEISIPGSDHEKIWKEIADAPDSIFLNNQSAPQNTIQKRFSKNEYLDTIKSLQQHILRGDCYEVNFCQEYFVPDCRDNPSSLYARLMELSPNPFSAFYKHHDKYLLCASPERYLRKTGNRIYSQPIKGTAVRNLHDPETDRHNRELLKLSAKDRSENVMVVDLVRNDLSRVCTEGSVTVEELFGIYSFPQVHQMISTIGGNLQLGRSVVEILQAGFPMGSMTGAPKKRVMELIEQYEKTRRGLFSGAVGYITPEKDFDFNVVIRSILFNTGDNYLSFQTGSGITYYSNPESEYQECEMKATAIRSILSG